MLISRKLSVRSFDWILLTSVLLLMAMGIAAIYSVDLSRGETLLFFKKQLISFGLGMGLLLFASVTQFTFFRSYAKLFYFFSLVLLVAVLLFGNSIRGTKGWFSLGGFSFQPVELAKAGIIFILAYVIYHFGRRFERPLFFFGTACITLLMMALVMLQPDLGSALLIGAVWLGLMLLVGARKRYLVGLLGVVAAVSVLGWFFFLQDYQKARIRTFIHPEEYAWSAGYNTIQAEIAVGAGQWLGRGLARGSQSQLRFLPEAQTDFIFSVISEELGFVGVAALVTLYGIMLWRLIVIVQNATDDFVAATVSGIAILFFVQFFVNVGANIGLMPITGVTLPFVSYGGSSLLVNLFLIGVAESMVGKRY